MSSAAFLTPAEVAARLRLPNVFGYASRDSARKAWNRTIARAGIKQLSYHSLRHGFATSLLRAGVDILTVAKLGGWRSPAHVFSTYGHASDDKTLTDRLIDTPVTQQSTARAVRPKKSIA